MKAVTYLLRPEDGHYGRVGKFFHDEQVFLVAVHSIDGLDDGTVVMQFELAERVERIEEVLSPEPDWVYGYEIATGDARPMLQLHFEPGGIHSDILALHRSAAVTLDFPIDVVDPATQTFRVTEVGKEADLRDLLQRTTETVDVTIERIGEYTPVGGTVFDDLTSRQQQVLGTAVELGYYDEPRHVTYEDIAAELDCSASAVGQHLRRAEETVMSEVVSETHRIDSTTAQPI